MILVFRKPLDSLRVIASLCTWSPNSTFNCLPDSLICFVNRSSGIFSRCPNHYHPFSNVFFFKFTRFIKQLNRFFIARVIHDFIVWLFKHCSIRMLQCSTDYEVITTRDHECCKSFFYYSPPTSSNFQFRSQVNLTTHYHSPISNMMLF